MLQVAKLNFLIKKSTLDIYNPSNYYLLSKLSSKVLERSVSTQLIDYLIITDNIIDAFQSAHLHERCTKTHIHPWSYIRLPWLLTPYLPYSFFHLSSAFDTLNHQILSTSCLLEIGIHAQVHTWLISMIGNPLLILMAIYLRP